MRLLIALGKATVIEIRQLKVFRAVAVGYLLLLKCSKGEKKVEEGDSGMTSFNWFGISPEKLSEAIGEKFPAVASTNGVEGEAVGASHWNNLKERFQAAQQQVSDVVTNLMDQNSVISSGLETGMQQIETLRSRFPSLTDLESFRGTTWDSFISSMMPTTPDLSAEQDFSAVEQGKAIAPECKMTTPEIIRHSGFPCEVHVVETDDGYRLAMHRIPHGRSSTHPPGPVVFLQHGILADSSCWAANGPDHSLAFILADRGFDVWLGNARGNTYSREHRQLNADTDERFWRFSWQESAEFDLPAMVDRALAVSGRRRLYYVGHSQGTLIAFARLSEDAALNAKIAAMFALAPVVTIANLTSPVRSLTPLTKLATAGTSVFGGAEILPNKPITKWISAKLHRLHVVLDADDEAQQQHSVSDKLVYHGNNLMMYLCGFNRRHYFRDRLAVYFAHTPAGTSLQNILHMSQLVQSGKCHKFDHGAEKNRALYGQLSAPEYDVSKVATPVAIFVGDEDQFSVVKDVDQLRKTLASSVVSYRLLHNFDHLDFIWGTRARELVYDPMIEAILAAEGSDPTGNSPGPSTRSDDPGSPTVHAADNGNVHVSAHDEL